MEFVSLAEKADKEQRFSRLYGTGKFCTWMLHFKPGDHTDMHYHTEPESFLVVEGKASVKGIDGDERIIEQGEVVFFNPKDYYQITNVGTGRLLLYGNRPEPFGGDHVSAK
jgi:mannose-6-phosphate isomerase-like protein (cupin superfamily)